MEEYKDPLIGRTIKSYRLTDKLGGGAFGAVYRAEHTRINKSFAVKVLHPHIASNEEVVKRFRREAQSLAALDHPNIVQIVDFDQNDEVGLFLILEWLKGEPLSKILKQETRLSIEQTENLFIQLLAALAEAHAQGIVHRDLKPANLMVLPAGQSQILKVLDFGIASLNDDNQELTTDGTAMGSANYMSPEQALGKVREIDERSDLYSCGIILGKCLTGKNVFAADSPTQILWKHIYEPAPRLTELYPEGNFTEALEQVFARSIAKEKEDRFQNAQEFAEIFKKAMQEARSLSLVSSSEGVAIATAASVLVTPRISPVAAMQLPTSPVATSTSGIGAMGGLNAAVRNSPPVARASQVVTASPVQTRHTPLNTPAAAHLRSPGRSSTALDSAAIARAADHSSTRNIDNLGTSSMGRHDDLGSVMVRGKQDKLEGESSSSSMSSPSIASNSNSRSAIRSMRGQRSSSNLRGISTAAKQPTQSIWEKFRWLIIGGLCGVLAVIGILIFILNRPTRSIPSTPTPIRQNTPDNLWKDLEKNTLTPKSETKSETNQQPPPNRPE